MEDQNYIRIFTGSIVMSKQLEYRLKEAGINPVIKNETESGRLAGFGPAIIDQVQVFVHKDEYEHALKIQQDIS
ncbi:putative signal transducing protein [Galbibacter sp.]|uniref:putative signal transducing protein n=1 Tax=Galbibacter sp. TaxID=2918471 RepID=UPI003A95470F